MSRNIYRINDLNATEELRINNTRTIYQKIDVLKINLKGCQTNFSRNTRLYAFFGNLKIYY